MNDESRFEIGALSRLRSGGPAMTVHAVDSDDVTCHWFVKEELKHKVFKLNQLQDLEIEQISDQELARRISFLLDKGKVAGEIE